MTKPKGLRRYCKIQRKERKIEKPAYEAEIKHNLESMQKAVGGLIDIVCKEKSVFNLDQYLVIADNENEH